MYRLEIVTQREGLHDWRVWEAFPQLARQTLPLVVWFTVYGCLIDYPLTEFEQQTLNTIEEVVAYACAEVR